MMIKMQTCVLASGRHDDSASKLQMIMRSESAHDKTGAVDVQRVQRRSRLHIVEARARGVCGGYDGTLT
jgi:hypothetical protein